MTIAVQIVSGPYCRIICCLSSDLLDGLRLVLLLALRIVQAVSSSPPVKSFYFDGTWQWWFGCSSVVYRLTFMVYSSWQMLFNSWAIECCHCWFLIFVWSKASMGVRILYISATMRLRWKLACAFGAAGLCEDLRSVRIYHTSFRSSLRGYLPRLDVRCIVRALILAEGVQVQMEKELLEEGLTTARL